MFYIFNNKNKCISTSDFEPNIDDLKSRKEYYVESEEVFYFNTVYAESRKIVIRRDLETEAKKLIDKLRSKLDKYLTPAAMYNDKLVTMEQKEILTNDSVKLALWYKEDGWPNIELPEMDKFTTDVLNNPVWSFSEHERG